MSVRNYRFKVFEKPESLFSIEEVLRIIKAWRFRNATSNVCESCGKRIKFGRENFKICCLRFYFIPTKEYLVKSIVVDTPGRVFLPKFLKSKINHEGQDFLVLPDPVYWQVKSTLVYERVLKSPLHNDKHYLQIQDAPLNHGSLTSRSQGKNTFFRKVAYAKRARNTARMMIVPAPHLPPNEVVLPHRMKHLLGKWIIVNRMPSLLPENFVGLRVSELWSHPVIGLPCEVLVPLNADFDGDEVNVWPVESLEAQAECREILNSRANMKSFTLGIKLYPPPDMLVIYSLYREELFEFPLRHVENLPDALQTVFEMYGSETCFNWFNALRKFYLNAIENRISLSLSFKDFEDMGGMIRILLAAKGSTIHLDQLTHTYIPGMTPEELIDHVKIGFIALIESMINVWRPGYSYSKLCNIFQDAKVNYMGEVVDNKQVVFQDAIDEGMSFLTFQHLTQEYLTG